MRSLLARLAVLGVLAVSMSACAVGNSSSLPFGGPPNNNSGSVPNFQTGANGTALIRFVQGSPDVGQVDICVGQSSSVSVPSAAISATNVAYKSSALLNVAGGIANIVTVYAAIGGAECATAPAAFNGRAPIAFTSFTPAANTRTLIALGGRAGKNLGLYAWSSPAFPVPPASGETIAYNDAPTFGNVGFGFVPTAGTPTNLTGATNIAAPKAATGSSVTPATNGATIVSATTPLTAIPASFFDGKGVTTGSVVPVTTVAAIAPVSGQAYVVDLIAVDSATAAGLDLVQVLETTMGYGF